MDTTHSPTKREEVSPSFSKSLGHLVQLQHKGETHYGILKCVELDISVTLIGSDLVFPVTEAQITELDLGDLFDTDCFPTGGIETLKDIRSYPEGTELCHELRLRDFNFPMDAEVRLWRANTAVSYEWWDKKVSERKVAFYLNEFGFPNFIVQLNPSDSEEKKCTDYLRKHFIEKVLRHYQQAADKASIMAPPYGGTQIREHYFFFGPRPCAQGVPKTKYYYFDGETFNLVDEKASRQAQTSYLTNDDGGEESGGESQVLGTLQPPTAGDSEEGPVPSHVHTPPTSRKQRRTEHYLPPRQFLPPEDPNQEKLREQMHARFEEQVQQISQGRLQAALNPPSSPSVPAPEAYYRYPGTPPNPRTIGLLGHPSEMYGYPLHELMAPQYRALPEYEHLQQQQQHHHHHQQQQQQQQAHRPLTRSAIKRGSPVAEYPPKYEVAKAEILEGGEEDMAESIGTVSSPPPPSGFPKQRLGEPSRKRRRDLLPTITPIQHLPDSTPSDTCELVTFLSHGKPFFPLPRQFQIAAFFGDQMVKVSRPVDEQQSYICAMTPERQPATGVEVYLVIWDPESGRGFKFPSNRHNFLSVSPKRAEPVPPSLSAMEEWAFSNFQEFQLHDMLGDTQSAKRVKLNSASQAPAHPPPHQMPDPHEHETSEPVLAARPHEEEEEEGGAEKERYDKETISFMAKKKRVNEIFDLVGRFCQVQTAGDFYYGVLAYTVNATFFTLAGIDASFPMSAEVKEIELRDMFSAPFFPHGGPDDLAKQMRGYSEDSEFCPDLRTFTPPRDRELKLWKHGWEGGIKVKSEWWKAKVEKAQVLYYLNDHGFPYWIVKLDVDGRNGYDSDLISASSARRNFNTIVIRGYWDPKTIKTPPYGGKPFTLGQYKYYVFGPRPLRSDSTSSREKRVLQTSNPPKNFAPPPGGPGSVPSNPAKSWPLGGIPQYPSLPYLLGNPSYLAPHLGHDYGHPHGAGSHSGLDLHSSGSPHLQPHHLSHHVSSLHHSPAHHAPGQHHPHHGPPVGVPHHSLSHHLHHPSVPHHNSLLTHGYYGSGPPHIPAQPPHSPAASHLASPSHSATSPHLTSLSHSSPVYPPAPIQSLPPLPAHVPTSPHTSTQSHSPIPPPSLSPGPHYQSASHRGSQGPSSLSNPPAFPSESQSHSLVGRVISGDKPRALIEERDNGNQNVSAKIQNGKENESENENENENENDTPVESIDFKMEVVSADPVPVEEYDESQTTLASLPALLPEEPTFTHVLNTTKEGTVTPVTLMIMSGSLPNLTDPDSKFGFKVFFGSKEATVYPPPPELQMILALTPIQEASTVSVYLAIFDVRNPERMWLKESMSEHTFSSSDGDVAKQTKKMLEAPLCSERMEWNDVLRIK
eukprot:TRINITY_DN6788_c0_g1_i1.p1 TRINITY_DN6788_c0_g1~~TRINITY_DN6788_c0_g1_i1.p1  ORF type:complete len:1370 (-),score=262.58 TRINITY_DN6788_c0_g1_i1:209-4318(-)